MSVSMLIHHAKPRLVSESPENGNSLTINFGDAAVTLFFDDTEIEDWWSLRSVLPRSSSASYWHGERRLDAGPEAETLARNHYANVKGRLLAAHLDAAQ